MMSTSNPRPRLSRRRTQNAATGSRRPTPRGSLEAREHLAWAIARLSPSERLILSLRLLERLTPQEAAHSLGVSVQYLNRTYRALLSTLERIQRTHALLKGRGRREGAAPELRLRRAS